MAKRKQSKRVGARASETPLPNQPSPDEQSGSAGRNTETDKLDQGKDTGQDRYGQSGVAGKAVQETPGQANYAENGCERETEGESNQGSGRTDHESDEYSGELRRARTFRKK
jgi:hypothetical protein